DVHGAAAVRHAAAGERLLRRPLPRRAPDEGRLSVRDGHHDAARRAVRGDDRTPRRDVWRRHRHRAGDLLLDRAERLQRARRRGCHDAPDGGVGAEYPVRRGGRVHAPHGPYVGSAFRRTCYFWSAASRTAIVPENPGLVFVRSTTSMTL